MKIKQKPSKGQNNGDVHMKRERMNENKKEILLIWPSHCSFTFSQAFQYLDPFADVCTSYQYFTFMLALKWNKDRKKENNPLDVQEKLCEDESESETHIEKDQLKHPIKR